MSKIDTYFKKEKIFLYVYFISFLGLYLSLTDITQFSSFFSKFKSIYIFICFVDILSHKKLKSEVKSSICIGLLSIYVILFGCIIKYPTAHIEIRNHRILMTYYLLMLILTVLELQYYECYEQFITYTYQNFNVFIIICAFTHFHQIVWNPFYIFTMFIQNIRVISNFGFRSSNFIGSFGYVTLVFSIIHLMILKEGRRLKKYYLFFVLFCDTIVYLVLQSSSSRTPILSLIIFVIFVSCFEVTGNKSFFTKRIRMFIRYSAFILLPVILVALSKFRTWSYIWHNSNREMNISENIHFVGVIGTKWTGMGFVENAAFIHDPWNGIYSAFGVATSSLDMYYIYLYCTTGILGCFIVGGIMLFMLYSVWKNRNIFMGRIILALFISIIFYAFWESIIFTYRFWNMLPVMVLIMVYLGNSTKKTYLIL